MNTISLKQVLATALLALPLSAFAGHNNFIQELARTDGDPQGVNAHMVTTPAKPATTTVSTATQRFVFEQLARTDGNVNPMFSVQPRLDNMVSQLPVTMMLPTPESYGGA